MIAPKFEIKVALLGHVSAGKTTILNALLQDKYSEVSMRRTTAGINFFRVSVPEEGRPSTSKDSDESYVNLHDDSASSETNQVADVSSDKPVENKVQSARETLETIQADNTVRRTDNTIQEKFFDITLDKHLFEMRADTRLVLVDIPGINEAGTSKTYLDYVTKEWDSFDCVVVVMDAIQGVNTEEQVNLLNFVKQNLNERKNLPVIVLCNKVDDPDDGEVATLVDEVRDKVKEIFETGCLESSLNTILEETDEQSASWPAFLPLSAATAYVYRAVSRLKMEDFKTLDKELIDKIGRDEVGRFKWKRFSDEEKYHAVCKAVHDPSQYKERLEATNFDKFLRVLSCAVGSKKTQQGLIEKQLEVSVRNLTAGTSLSDELSVIYSHLKVIGKSTDHLKDRFWELHNKFQDTAILGLFKDFDAAMLHDAMDQLIDYGNAVNPKLHHGSEALEEEDKIIHTMKNLIKVQHRIILEKEFNWKMENSRMMAVVLSEQFSWEWTGEKWSSKLGCFQSGPRNQPPADCPSHWDELSPGFWKNKYTGNLAEGPANPAYNCALNWKNMSPMDWNILIGSVLLPSSNEFFVQNLGPQKLMLESLMIHGNSASYLRENGKLNKDEISALPWGAHKVLCEDSLQGRYGPDGSYTPKYPEKINAEMCKLAVGITVPESLSDPNHWGHLSWKFCEFMKSREAFHEAFHEACHEAILIDEQKEKREVTSSASVESFPTLWSRLMTVEENVNETPLQPQQLSPQSASVFAEVPTPGEFSFGVGLESPANPFSNTRRRTKVRL